MAITVQSNSSISISKHIQEIILENYGLPEFQRTFVWTDEKVKNLWTSLYAGFPIGQLMLWEPDKTNFPIRAIGRKQNSISKLKYALIDGQQRLSAIYLVLLGNVQLFFNLETEKFVNATEKENAIKLDILNGRSFDEADEANYFFVNATGEQAGKYARKLNKLNSMFTNTILPFQTISNCDYDIIVTIFNRLNQEGVKLTEGQIALANISTKWQGVFSRTFELLRKINDEYNYSKNENPDLIIQTWTAIHTGQHLVKHIAPESEQSKYYKLSKQELYTISWSKLEAGFEKTFKILKDKFDFNNYQFIPGYFSLVVLVNFIANHPNCSETEISRLLKWFVHSLIQGRFSERSASRLREDIKATNENKVIENLFNHRFDPLNPDKINIQEQNILNASFKSPYSTLLYILMRKSGATDFFDTNCRVGDYLPDDKPWHFHHIFPVSNFKGDLDSFAFKIENIEDEGSETDIQKILDEKNKFYNLIYSTANLSFLTPSTNIRISDNKPSDYLKVILNSNNGSEILKKQFIPLDTNLWKHNSYMDFLKERSRLIIEGISTYLKPENLI